jgi:hypothetical protein
MHPRLSPPTLRAIAALVALSTAPVVHAQTTDLGVVKNYLLGRITAQKSATARLTSAANQYLAAAKAVNFGYTRLASSAQTRVTLQAARAAWKDASPVYESMEGIVSGVEAMQVFDTNLDAGSSKTDGGDNVVTFDLNLPNGKRLERPGNLFGMNEATLWGSEKSYSSGVKMDLDGDGKIGFGDVLPDANVLAAAAAKLDAVTAELQGVAKGWTPTVNDVVAALKTNIPTAATVFIDRWKLSRFVLGDATKSREFNVISSLNDLEQNIGSWKSLYGGLSGAVKVKNASLDAQINAGLDGLKAWIVKLQAQEKVKRFTPEQAEIIAKESQNRATAIVGKVIQASALLEVK